MKRATFCPWCFLLAWSAAVSAEPTESAPAPVPASVEAEVLDWSELLTLPGRALDIGVGEVDGSGGLELVVLYPKQLEVYALSSKPPLSRIGVYGFEHLPQGAEQVRDPTGHLVVADFNADGLDEVFYFVFGFRAGEMLRWGKRRFTPLRSLDKVPMCVFRKAQRANLLFGTPRAGTNQYLPQLLIADINASAGTALSVPSPFINLKCVQRDPAADPWIVSVDVSGNVWIWRGQEWDLLFSRVGAAIAISPKGPEEGWSWLLADRSWPGEKDGFRVLNPQRQTWRKAGIEGDIRAALLEGNLEKSGLFGLVLVGAPDGTSSRVFSLAKKR